MQMVVENSFAEDSIISKSSTTQHKRLFTREKLAKDIKEYPQ